MSERKPVPEPVRRIELFTGAGHGRIWSAEDKATIVAEGYVAGAAACAVARRHALTSQHLLTWRRLARLAGQADVPAMFIPAVAEPSPAGPAAVGKWVRRRVKASAIELEAAA